MTFDVAAGFGRGNQPRREFELLSRLRESARSRQLSDLPGLFLLAHITSLLGFPFLRAFYRGDSASFADFADTAQRIYLVPIIILICALKLHPRALQMFLMGTIFMLIFAEVWLSFFGLPPLG
jgi:hypothetical protein